MIGATLLVVVGGAWQLHLRRGKALADAEQDPSGPTKRVMRNYAAFVSFLSILVLVVALAVAVHDVMPLFSQSIFGGSSNRTDQLRSIHRALVLVALFG